MTQNRRQPVDQRQRDRAVNDLDTCFLVEAAAGTGKTTLLVSRIMALLRQGRASLPEIAAITFTEKAAGELKVRLRREIERHLRDDGITDKAPLRNALSDLDAMTVSTIHSFCSELIRERPVEAGVEPNFAMADELAASLIFQETWETWLAEQMVPGNGPLRRAIEYGVSYTDSEQNSSRLFGLASLLNEHHDLLSEMTMTPPWDDARLEDAIGDLRELADKLVEVRDGSCTNPEDKGALQIGKLAAWVNSLEKQDFDGLLNWLRTLPAVRPSFGNKKNWSPVGALKEMKSLAKEFKALCETLSLQAGHRVLCDLVEWITPFLERYAAAKAQRRMLDFQDLLIFARNMLRDDAQARAYFKRAYRYLLVDEFQDTDPLQTEIVFFLAERQGDFAPDWESVRLAPGKLFLVGDPKQSIYGFRRADLDLYGRVRSSLESQGDVLTLSVNFRTVPELIGEVNRVFEPLMTGPVKGRFEPSHVALVPYRHSGGNNAGLRFISPPETMDRSGMKAETWRRKEAGCIAACIQEMVERDVQVYDSDRKAWRPVKYRDMAVIFRATTGLESLEDAMRAHDVPYQVSGGKHYYARQEFQDLLCVLKAVENPCDSLNVVGALRSAFFGHSDEDLLRHFAAGGSFNTLENVPSDCVLLANAFETLRSLHAIRNTSPISFVLTELFVRTQALQIYAMKPHGEQRVANLLKVIEMGRRLADVETASFGSLVRMLAQMEDTGQAEGESPVAEADEDFVQLLTFHKAKGLEYPVIFLANLGSRGSRSDSFVFDRRLHRLDLNLGKGITTAHWEAAIEEKKDREDHEARRLFYVAMTRARDLLVVPAYWWARPGDGLLRYLRAIYPPDAQGGVECDERLRIPTEAFAIDEEAHDHFLVKTVVEDDMPPEATAFWKHRRDWWATLRERAPTLNAGRRIVTASELVGADTHIKKPTASRDEAGGKEIGTLVHDVLEVADFRNPGDLQAPAVALARDRDLSPADIRSAVELVERALALPLIAERAAKAQEVYREVPFTVEDGGTLLEGRVDLIFLEDDGAVIVDYKTDRISENGIPARVAHYRPQAELYARAMGKVLDLPVKEVAFLFVQPGVAASATIGQRGSA